ncbi:MAG TPA: cell division protein CrgA [Nocardioides sp.]|nr:cell division protein CrgA [Nocardioides sp.]
MRAKQAKQFDPLAPVRGKVFTVRFLVAIALVVLGIAWITYYYAAVRVDPTVLPAPEAGSPKFMADLKDWNYLIGFGAVMLGLVISAHPDTPLGRGRGVVVGMLACFLFGLLWICTFYVISNNIDALPIFDDLGQFNLLVGIGFMGVGFTYATRWE